MMRYVIADGLPYLLHNDKTYAVRLEKPVGYTVGAEVKLASVPSVTYSELSIRAMLPNALDSIGKQEQPEQTEQEEEPSQEQPEQTDNLEEMTLSQLKALAEDTGIKLGNARKKADIIKAIKDVLA